MEELSMQPMSNVKRLRVYLLSAAGLAILVMAGVVKNSAVAQGQGQGQGQGSAPVTIVNPLPVPVAGSVAVSGTANVNVVNAPLRVAVDATQQPFQKTLCTVGWPPGCLSTPSSFNVPSDKRLVIEYVSGQCDTASLAESVGLMSVSTLVSSVPTSHYVVPQFLGSVGSVKLYGSAQQTRIYADPGTQVYASASGFPTGSVGCLVSLSGYLVNP
jgi:hypothetical protein